MTYSTWPANKIKPFYNEHILGRPYEHHYSALLKTEEMDDNSSLSMLQAYRLISDNFAALQVKIDQMTLLEYVDHPEITATEFMSSMGGALNLWAGITVVVGVELVELLYELMKTIVVGSKKEKGTENNTGADPQIQALAMDGKENGNDDWVFTTTP